MSQGNPDIRQQVEDSRGPQKKLEMMIPGLRNYRKLEDLRVSDDMLRNQVADRLDRSRGNLDMLRKQMTTAGDFMNLTAVGSLVSQVQALSGEIRHAAQGYSGWVASVTINDDKLNALYEYDYQFVSAVFAFEAATAPGTLVYDTTSPNSIQATLGTLGRNVLDIRQKWSTRMEAIEGIALQ